MPISRKSYPAVAEALLSGASAQLRNAATVGGNLLQRTRCAYFYDTASACNKREPGAGCDARGGENRLHAVLGWSDACIATHPSDFCVPLVALDAVVEIEGRTAGARSRSMPCIVCPATRPSARTSLEPGDLIVALRLPAEARAFATHARYLKVRERTSYAFAVVSAAAALRHRRAERSRGADRARRRCRQSHGGPARRKQHLAGAAPDAGGFRRAAEAALADAKPSGDNAFKIELARRIVVRALTLAAAGTPERIPALPASPFSSVPGAHPCLKSASPKPRPCPARLEHRPAADPPRRHPEGHGRGAATRRITTRPACCYAVLAVSQHRARPRHLPRCAAAKRHPGVVEVMTPANRPPLAQDPDAKTNPFMFRLELLQNDQVRYANQPIAVVIAETLEAATEGAALLAPRYEAMPARVGLDGGESFVPPGVGVGNPAEMRHGDVEAGLAAASQRDRCDLRDTGAVSQRDGAARDRGGMGRRHAVDRYADPGPRHVAGAHRRAVRHCAGEDPYPQPLPRRRLRLQGPDRRAAGARHPGGAAGRPAGQARAAP